MLCTSLSHYLSRHIVLFKGITIVGNHSCKGPDSCARKMPNGETTPTNITALSEHVFQVGDRSCNGTMSCTRPESLEAVVTIENDSCNGVQSCLEFESSSNIGSESCNAQQSCSVQKGAFAGENFVSCLKSR